MPSNYAEPCFHLFPETVRIIKSKKPRFGYGEFGEFIFYSHYSRNIDGKQETWHDVVIRVIEGVFSIRKDWYTRNHIPWKEALWQDYAKTMAISMFRMEWLPPGRGLWAMGTPLIYERGGMPLYNCAFTRIAKDWVEDACWLMDCLMHGVGVGFEPCRQELELHCPRGEFEFVIPDTREGWVESVRYLLNAYAHGGPAPIFDYSMIRPEGSPLVTFGGTASGPGPLMDLHDSLITLCHDYMEYMDSDVVRFKTDLANLIGVCVVTGNVRRSAEMGLAPISDPIFAGLKDYNKYPWRKKWGWMSNNSVKVEKQNDFESFGELVYKNLNNCDLGFVNMLNMPYGRIGKRDNVRPDEAVGLNPCLTGATKIGLANGRGYVAIADLVGQDADVYCVNEFDEIVVRTMRNIRVTGLKQKIYKVIFDNGDTIRVTGNHKFMLKDRTFKEVTSLTQGDQLAVMSRYVPSQQKDSYCDQYVSLSYGAKVAMEHRLITESNLRTLESRQHLSNHSKGEENSNWSGYTNEVLLQIGVQLCKKLNRRFSRREWQELAIVKGFSDYRSDEFISIVHFASQCADLAGVLNEPIDTRILRTWNDLLDQGYEVDIDANNQLLVKRNCEACGSVFWIHYQRREQACCSQRCAAKLHDYSKNQEGLRRFCAQRAVTKRDRQLDIYTKLKNTLGRNPLKKEWADACKSEGSSAEISRPSSPFRTYSDLQYAALGHNHRVLQVLEDGEEDVYNGTVDKYHNFFVGGWVSNSNFDRRIERGILNTQCGELPLYNKETCNVPETLPTRCVDINGWLLACEYATFYASTVALLPTHQSETNSICMQNRRIGVSIVDFTGWKHQYGVAKITKALRDGYNTVRSTNQRLAAQAGIPESLRVTTVKPGGTVPKIAGRTSGIMYPNYTYMIRRVRIQQGTQLEAMLIEANVPYENDFYSKMTSVFEFPVYTGEVKPASSVSVWEQAMNIVLLQREWADNAVSNTLVYKEEEAPELENVLLSIAPLIKSAAVCPEITDMPQMPEEAITAEEYNKRKMEINHIDWSQFSCLVSESDKFCTGDHCEIPK